MLSGLIGQVTSRASFETIDRAHLSAIPRRRNEPPQRYRVRRLDGRTGFIAANVEVCARWPEESPARLSRPHDLEALCPAAACEGQYLRLLPAAARRTLEGY